MKHCLIDSCVRISFINTHDSNHKKAVSLIKQSQNIILLDHVLAETVTVLKSKVSVLHAKLFLGRIRKYADRISIYRTTELEFHKTLHLICAESKLSFIDMLLILIAKEQVFTLVTFDKDMLKRLSK